MQKTLRTLILMLVLMVALAPYLVGLFFKQQLNDYLLKLNQSDNIKVSLIHYHVGWFTSNAKFSISLMNASRLLGIEITTDAIIHHGPLAYNNTTDQFDFTLARAETNIHLPEPLEQQIGITQSGILHITSLLNFNGKIDSIISSPVLTYAPPGGNKIVWAGTTGSSLINMNQFSRISSMQSDITIGAVNTPLAIDNHFAIQSSPITMTYTFTNQSDDNWNSIYTLSAPNINANDNLLSKLTIRYENGVTDEKYHLIEYIKLDKLTIPNTLIPNINNSEINISITNINYKAMHDFLNFTNTQSYQSLSSSTLQQKTSYLLFSMANANTVIDSKAIITTDLGNLTLNGNIHWSSATENNVASLKKNINLVINGRIAIPLATKLLNNYFTNLIDSRMAALKSSSTPIPKAEELTNAQIELLTKRGFIIKDNNDYTITISNNAGDFKINGKIADFTAPPANPPANNNPPTETAPVKPTARTN